MTPRDDGGCVVPAGIEAEADRRMAAYISEPLDAKSPDGWYEIAPVPQSADYVAAFPVALDLSATPYFVGATSGGPGYGDRVDSRMFCGHVLTVHNGVVTIERIDGGFAAFDARDILADKPLPTEAGTLAMEPHPVRFEIAGVRYHFVVTSIEVELVQVHRPDIQELSKKLLDAGLESGVKPPDYLYPVVGTVRGLLFASEPIGLPHLGEVGGARKRDAVAPAMIGNGMLSFSASRREVSTDLRDTPVAIGQVLGGSADRHKEMQFENGFDLAMSGETLVVTKESGGSTEVELAAWFDAQSGVLADGDVLITAPVIEFSLEGTRYRLVVTLLRTLASERGDGLLGFEGDFILGHLFAAR